MSNNNEREIIKSATNGIESSLNKLLEAAKTDPAIKELLDNLNLIAQSKAEHFYKLQNAVELHPEDAASMTLYQFIEAHPEIFDANSIKSSNTDQLSIFDNSSAGTTVKALAHPTLSASALTNLLKQFFNNPNRIESPRQNRITIEEHYLTKNALITYKSDDATYTLTVERIKELFAKRVQNGAKIFNFLLEKLNEQNYVEQTEFLLSELIDAGIYASPDTAYRGLKTVLEKLMRIHVEGSVKTYEGRKRKEVGFTKAAIIGEFKVTYNKCVATLPSIIRGATPYITILPRWSYALQSENAYMLLDYIYYLARQNTDKLRNRGYFTINLDTLRQHLGIPSPDEVKDGHYNQLIIKPIEDAITAIEEAQEGDELKITPVYIIDYKNIHEYLNGYLEIRMSGASFEYMMQRAIQEEKRIAEAKRKALPPKKPDKDKKED